MSKVYIVSDLHIGHTDIHERWRTEYCSQSDHDEDIVRCWNTVVKKRDVVKVLGDFIIRRESLRYLKELNGTIHWILGNHDPKITADILQEYPNVAYVGGVMAYKGAVLSHAPIHPQELEYRNWAVNIHGHIHDEAKNNLGDQYYNANVDIMGKYPREFHSIMAEVKAKQENTHN
jgi:calcineurin-like phosphoesterase family protein